MCGIIGYQGRAEAAQILLDGLTNLEYRGYDSAGIAVWQKKEVTLIKAQGRLQELKNLVYQNTPKATCGIGHTRWATHGVPSRENAHPHQNGSVTLVHNGIIENYGELKSQLQSKGITFYSQTDTEVAAAVVDSYYHGDPLTAIKEATKQMVGSYAFGILFADRPEELYAIRHGSPLIAAKDEGGSYIASDLPAILAYTREYTLLEEGELVSLVNGELTVYDHDLNPVEKTYQTAQWSLTSAQKDGYDYFTLKEIGEQPKAVENTLSPRIKNGLPDFGEELPLSLLQGAKRIIITACGTALYAGMIGKYAIEKLMGVPVEIDIASELRYRDPIIMEGDVAIVISQSGETADSLAAVRLLRERGVPVIAIVNVVGSSIAREADYTLYTYAGPEIGVASTKAYSVQMSLLYLLSIYGSKKTGEEKAALLQELLALCPIIGEAVGEKEQYQAYAKTLLEVEDLFYIGRGVDYAMAQEGSLKLKEISYIHCEAYAAGELKHGTISLITEGTPVIAIATQERLLHKTLSNMQEVRARGGKVLLLTLENMEIPTGCCDQIIRLPVVPELFTPFVVAVAIQSIAAYTAIVKGNDVDKPRNLAKSVTVE